MARPVTSFVEGNPVVVIKDLHMVVVILDLDRQSGKAVRDTVIIVVFAQENMGSVLILIQK